MLIVDEQRPATSDREVLSILDCNNDYDYEIICTKSVSVQYTVSSSYTSSVSINTGVSVSNELSIEVAAGIVFSTKTRTAFTSTVTNEFAFSSSTTIEKSESVTHTDEVSVPLPPHSAATIFVTRVKKDVKFNWKAELQVMGPFYADFINWYEYDSAVSKLMADDKVKAFGTYDYPDEDVIEITVIGNDGTEIRIK